MGQLFTLLQFSAYGLGICASVCFVLLIFLYRRNEKKERTRLKQTKTDIADMMILFQTMRDIIGQQKSLAREFNAELDKKMALVQQVLAQGVERNEQLYEQQQVLREQLDEAQEQLRSLQRQIIYLQDAPEKEEMLPQEEHFGPSLRSDSDEAAMPVEQPQQQASPLAQSPLTQFWSELNKDTPASAEEPLETSLAIAEEEKEDDGDAPIETQEEVLKSRDAFRTLLDMEPAMEQGTASVITEQGAQGTTADKGSGARVSAQDTASKEEKTNPMAPLQKRVIAYNEAGMAVPEIARELGIGKGEVRLMLSLGKQKKK